LLREKLAMTRFDIICLFYLLFIQSEN